MEVKKLSAAFYCTTLGNEPVREWLQSLENADRRIIGQDIATAEFGWPVGMPVCRGRGLYEIRSDLTSRRIARIILCVADGRMVLLHGFIKKTQKTPKADLDLALKEGRRLPHEEEKHEPEEGTHWLILRRLPERRRYLPRDQRRRHQARSRLAA